MAFSEGLPESGFAVGLVVVPPPETPGASFIAFSDRLPESGLTVGVAVLPAPVTPGESFMAFSERSTAGAKDVGVASSSAARMCLYNGELHDFGWVYYEVRTVVRVSAAGTAAA